MNLESNQMDIKRYKVVGKIVEKKKYFYFGEDTTNKSYFYIKSIYNQKYEINLNRIYYVKLKTGTYCELRLERLNHNIYSIEGNFDIDDFYNNKIYLAYNKYKAVGFLCNCLYYSKRILLFEICLCYDDRIKYINFKKKYYWKIKDKYLTLNRCFKGCNLYWLEEINETKNFFTKDWFEKINNLEDSDPESDSTLIWELNTDNINDYKYY